METVVISNYLKKFMKDVLGLKTNLHHNSITIKTTENRQCIILIGEFIMFCCEIPFCNVSNINLEQFKKDYFVLIESSENLGCCLLSLGQKKLLKHWPTGQHIFIDDYVNIGHDQVIVTFVGEHFHVTDFECCDFDTRKQHCERSHNNSDELEEVSTTLESRNDISSVISKRLLIMEKSLNELNSGIKEKQEVLQHSCNTLINMTLDRVYKPKVSSRLVSLFPEDSERDTTMTSCTIDDAPIHNFNVVDYWYRRATTKLIVGITVQNLSGKGATNFHLTIASSCGVTSCFQKVFCMYDGRFSVTKGDFDTSGMQSFDTKNFVVVTTFPKAQAIEYSVLAHYCISKTLDQKYGEFIGKITIKRSDLIGLDCVLSKTYLKRNSHDNIAVEASSCCCRFSLSSKVSSLVSIATTLSKRLHCHCDMIGKVIVLLLKSLFGEIRLQCGATSATGTIYAMSNDACLAILREIEEILPADVSIEREVSVDFVSHLAEKLSLELKSDLKTTKDLLRDVEKNENERNVVIIDSPEGKKRKQDEENENKDTVALFRSKEDTDQLVASIFDSI